ncbi:MAG: hypothetical protein Q8J97_05215 [Flavobacteriaceae bacterium]|nr:hypothetical protein [Flavobacteriaceae bacterium]
MPLCDAEVESVAKLEKDAVDETLREMEVEAEKDDELDAVSKAVGDGVRCKTGCGGVTSSMRPAMFGSSTLQSTSGTNVVLALAKRE